MEPTGLSSGGTAQSKRTQVQHQLCIGNRSSEIRRRIQLIVSATSKVTLNQQYQRLQEDFTAIHAALASLPQNEQQAALQQGYTELRQTTQQINDLVSARIDVDRRLALFAEQLDWLHQDIGMELSPMRQELQWQLERGGAASHKPK